MLNSSGGVVIHVSSMASIDGGPDVIKYGGSIPYSCSKSFLNMYVKTMGKFFKNKNIKFFSILPGPIMLKHKMWYKLKKEKPDLIRKFKRDYLKNKNFLLPKTVGNKIYDLCLNSFKLKSKFLKIN